MARAVWGGVTLAESDETIVVEGNRYFPPAAVNTEYLRDSNQHTTCPWKGKASYYDVVVGDDINHGAAWYYPDPKSAAAQISRYVAFWKGIQIEG